MSLRIIALLLIFSPFSAMSQAGALKKTTIKKLGDATTEIILTGDSEYDESFKKVIEEEWTISKFKYVTMDEFRNHENGDKVFALGNFKGNLRLPIDGKTWIDTKNESFFGLIHRFNSKGKFNTNQHISLYSYTIRDYKNINFETLLRFTVRKFNNDVMYENYSEYKERHEALKTTKILVNELDTLWTLDEIKEIYPYDVEIVSPERIESAINNKEKVLIATIIERDLDYIIRNTNFIFIDFSWADTGKLCFFTRASYKRKKKVRALHKKKLLEHLLRAAGKP